MKTKFSERHTIPHSASPKFPFPKVCNVQIFQTHFSAYPPLPVLTMSFITKIKNLKKKKSILSFGQNN